MAALKRMRSRGSRGNPAPLWGALFLLALLRLSWEGFTYLPLLDDHIQYYNYANLMGSLPQAVSRLGLLAARPLAGLLDIALWSRFWPFLFGATLLLTALLALSAYLLADLFGRLFQTDPLCFGVLFLLLPVNLEATYWLSAATRVIPGLLCAALAGRCVMHAAEEGGRPTLCLTGAGLCCLTAACFYEQAFVLAAALCVLVGLLKGRGRLLRLAAVLIPMAAFGLYLAATAAAGPSALYGARGALNLPLGDNVTPYFTAFLPELTRQLAKVYGSLFALTGRAFVRGLPLVARRPLGLLCALLLPAAAMRWAPARHGDLHPLRALSAGLFLALAPMAPFLVVGNPWVGLRALGCCLPGLALLGAHLMQRIAARRIRYGLAGLLALLFVTACASELSDYRQTARDDAVVVASLASALPQLGPAERVGVLGLMPSYLPVQNYEWHEHLHGVTESRWALTGALRAACGRLDVPTVTPLRGGVLYPEYADLSQYNAFLLVGENFSLYPVTHDGEGIFSNAAGAPVAWILPEQSGAVLTTDPSQNRPSGPG